MTTDTEPRSLGHHACPRALAEMTAALAQLPAGVPVRLTLPPVTPRLSDALAQLLEAAAGRSRVELVCNDWGTLARCGAWKRSHPGVQLTLGALLAEQDTDPMLAVFTQPQPDRIVRDGSAAVRLRWVPPPPALTAHWQTPSALHRTDILRTLGVDAVELCRQALEPAADIPGLPVERLPYAILSVRPCCGDCAACGGKTVTRGGRRLYWDRNLLLW